jgi:hypothetical protein
VLQGDRSAAALLARIEAQAPDKVPNMNVRVFRELASALARLQP